MDAAREAHNREAFRQAVVNTLERRLFYIPSFKIYRGVAGLYDYGPPGCAVKANVLASWRQVYSFLFIRTRILIWMFCYSFNCLQDWLLRANYVSVLCNLSVMTQMKFEI